MQSGAGLGSSISDEAYRLAGGMFDKMGVALGRERVRSALAALDKGRLPSR